MKQSIKTNVIMEKNLVTGITCDECKQKIRASQDYFEVNTYHDNWGRDSIDSHEHFDICDRECLIIHMEYYYKQNTGSGYHYKVESEKASETITPYTEGEL